MTTNQTQNQSVQPYDLIQRIQQQSHIGPFDPESVVEEEIFQYAARELNSLTKKPLYLTLRTTQLGDLLCTLWLNQPQVQPDANNDWHANKDIALLQTCIDEKYQSVAQRLGTQYRELSSARIANGRMYQVPK